MLKHKKLLTPQDVRNQEFTWRSRLSGGTWYDGEEVDEFLDSVEYTIQQITDELLDPSQFPLKDITGKEEESCRN